ncbi:hypothetical protein PSYPI_42430, partial [Pseudomonas syringae pv. pisi str. 1704B]
TSARNVCLFADGLGYQSAVVTFRLYAQLELTSESVGTQMICTAACKNSHFASV